MMRLSYIVYNKSTKESDWISFICL